MLYDCCVGTTVQRLLVWRRSKAHDREPQHSPMTRRRRYNVGPATVILGFLLTNGHLVALVVSAVLLFPSQLLERSLSANEQQEMPDQPQQEVLSHGCEKFFKKNWTLPNVQVTKAPSRRSEPYAPNSSPKIEAMVVLTCGSRSRSRCSSCSNSSCNWSRQRYDTSTRQLNKKKERLRLGSPLNSQTTHEHCEGIRGQSAGREISGLRG